MTKQVINVGTSANDKKGDSLRVAFAKVNQNFTELYTRTNDDIQIPSQTGNANKYLKTDGAALSWATVAGGGSGDSLVNGDSSFSVSSDGTLTLTHPAEPALHPLATVLTVQKAAGNYHTISGAYGLSLQATPVPGGSGLNTNTNFVDIFHDGISVNVNNNSWAFGTNGDLTLPTGGSIYGLNIIGGEGTNVQADQTTEQVYIRSYNTSSFATHEWTFGTDGVLALPANGTISYTPDDTDNWNEPTVNTIQAALDELAARVTALQNLEIDGGNAYTPALGELLIDGNGA